MASIKLSPECENVFLSALNEGDRYPLWCTLAANGATLSEWRTHVRAYYTRLRRERRCDLLSWLDFGFIALALRDYYTQHLKESES